MQGFFKVTHNDLSQTGVCQNDVIAVALMQVFSTVMTTILVRELLVISGYLII